MRTGRVARGADEADRRSRRERRARLDGRLEEREVAVRPAAAVRGAENEADAAVPRAERPGVLHDAVGEGVERSPHRRCDVGRRVVVVELADRDDRRAAPDREDVAAGVRRGSEKRSGRRCERGR